MCFLKTTSGSIMFFIAEKRASRSDFDFITVLGKVEAAVHIAFINPTVSQSP
jgi:hypothetical protein